MPNLEREKKPTNWGVIIGIVSSVVTISGVFGFTRFEQLRPYGTITAHVVSFLGLIFLTIALQYERWAKLRAKRQRDSLSDCYLAAHREFSNIKNSFETRRTAALSILAKLIHDHYEGSGRMLDMGGNWQVSIWAPCEPHPNLKIIADYNVDKGIVEDYRQGPSEPGATWNTWDKAKPVISNNAMKEKVVTTGHKVFAKYTTPGPIHSIWCELLWVHGRKTGVLTIGSARRGRFRIGEDLAFHQSLARIAEAILTLQAPRSISAGTLSEASLTNSDPGDEHVEVQQ